MSEHEEAGELVAEVTRFALEMTELLRGVLPTFASPFASTVSGTHVIVRQQPADGVILRADGEPLLRLHAKFRCTWDSSRDFLLVDQSTVSVLAHAGEEPLFRYDYDARSVAALPAAHLNVHAHRDETVFAMTGAGRRFRGKHRQRLVDGGDVPRLAKLHFPLGGHRFRPCLEDVLEAVIREFGIDTVDGWDEVIRAGRRRWREEQLRSAVRDDPQTAAEVLMRLGYGVIPPPEPPRLRAERIDAL